jgi:NADH-ubiquinone oxidoreductase chain 2
MLIADDSVLTIANIDNKSSKLILGVSLGFILIFSGFLFKMAAAPLHSWSPCVYDDSPTQVTI